MNVTFEILQWVEEALHPRALINNKIVPEDLVKLENGFLNQLKNYKEAVFMGIKLSRRRVTIQLRQLVNISNTIYDYLFHLTPGNKPNISSSVLRSMYLHLLIELEKTIDTVGKIEPETFSKIPITLYNYSCLKMEFKIAIKDFLNTLLGSTIDTKLYQMLERNFQLFITKKEINQSEVDYTTNLVKQLVNAHVTETSQLIEMLYINGFNPGDFFYYYTNELNNRLKDIPSLHDQLLVIIAEKDRFSGLPESRIKLFPCLASIDSQFKIFLSEKESHLKELIDLRRSFSQDEQSSKSSHRLKIFLSVAQLGLFIRLFVEKGLLAKENIGDQFTFFASHFSTPQAPFISAESLRKKSTDVEFSTAQKLKAHLIGMLNWLNENYNLSNFKGP